MAVSSSVVDELPGRGHTEHGKGKALGHVKHAQAAMEDGVYTMNVSGVDHTNHAASDQTSSPTTLADGTTLFTEVRAGSITTVDGPGAEVDGALRLETDSNNGRLRVTDLFDADNRFELGDLDTLQFNYYVESSSQTNQIPVIRLIVDADGDVTTTGDRGELVFEWAYQGLGATTTGQWQTADLAGGDWVAWQRSNGANHDEVANMTTLSDWADADGYTPTGGITFDEDSLVLGWSLASGSGNGTNVFYVDDIKVGGVTYDFLV